MRERDWEQRLAAFVAERRAMPFEWGRNDCCLFAADAVRAMTGDDHAIGLRVHTSAQEAARLVLARGGLRQIATDALGESVPPAMATVGDVVLLMNEGRELLAVCNGGTAIAPGERGMVALGMDAALAAWKV
ncbi:DUF6950 family protein [Xenophilus sp.]|uniref:DUF6950 family protein n=1 Tax=Xenophilus sp. TaxID=1873499 RepID=UPI0037DD2465